MRVGTWGTLARFVLFLGTLLSIDTSVKWLLFGHPLPLPYLVKQWGHYVDYLGAGQWNPVLYLLKLLIVACSHQIGFELRHVAPSS